MANHNTRIILEVESNAAGHFDYAIYRCPNHQIAHFLLHGSMIKAGTICRKHFPQFLRQHINEDINLLVYWEGVVANWGWHFPDIFVQEEEEGKDGIWVAPKL